MNNKISESRLNIAILIIAIALIILRHFDFFINPRFWAEEGSVYFLNAYIHGFSSLWFGHQGYFSIIPNISTYLATLVPLEYAPIVTTWHWAQTIGKPPF